MAGQLVRVCCKKSRVNGHDTLHLKRKSSTELEGLRKEVHQRSWITAGKVPAPEKDGGK